MRNFEDKVVKVISRLTCDSCGEEASSDDSEFHEFISVNHRCGYGSIHGDGNTINIDLCQRCFGGMCGDSLTVSEPCNDKNNDKLEYHNIFDAIELTKEQASNLKHDSDLRIAARDILLANKISDEEELAVALKRVEMLWDTQYHSADGNELHQLADLICAYEGISWDSYFSEVDAASDDLIADRDDIIKQKAIARPILSGTKVNNDIDDGAL
jgi:antitoxin CcdA